MSFKLTIFPTLSASGQQLATSVAELGSSLGFKANIPDEATQDEYLRASLCDSVVVVDASIENGGEDVYHIASVLPNLFDHVLVVSRTYLPLNFVPTHAGGTPPYPYPHLELLDGQLMSQFEGFIWNNEEILKWLESRLREIKDRLPGRRLTPEEFSALSEDPSPYREMLQSALERRKDASSSGRVFLSYRGKYYEEVKSLANRIEQGEFHEGEGKPVKVLSPGELALERELMSEGRRWMVSGLLDDELRACDELWVYQTDDYLGSWWTLGELVAAAYIGTDGKKGPKIWVFDREKELVVDNDGRYQVTLSEDQRMRMSRFLSNTRPETMGPENNKPIRWQRWIFRLGLGKYYLRRVRRMLEDPTIQRMYTEAMPTDVDHDGDLQKELLERFQDVEGYKKYLNDRVFSKEFWDELCIEAARVTGTEPLYPVDGEFFLTAPEKQMVRVSRREAARGSQSGRPVKAQDGKTVVSLEEAAPRYLWEPTRAAGLFRGGLRALPTYLVRESGEA